MIRKFWKKKLRIKVIIKNLLWRDY